MTAVAGWLAVQVPGGRLWGQLIRPLKLVGIAWCPRGAGRAAGLTPTAGTRGPVPCAARGYGWAGGQELLCPVGQTGPQDTDRPSLVCPHVGMEGVPSAPLWPVSRCPHWVPLLPRALPHSRHRPPHADAAQVRVEVEEGPDAEGLRHDVAERWPLCGLQAEETQDQLAQLGAVPVRDGCERAAHDLQHQRWQVL